jgi:hypothetical protein
MSAIRSDDPPRLREQIKQLLDLKYDVQRPTEHQVKVGTFNWYWGKGTITRDPHHRLTERGFEAFLLLVKEEGSRNNLIVRL